MIIGKIDDNLEARIELQVISGEQSHGVEFLVDDMQWLYDVNDDWKTYSHDHGLFLPGGTQWSQEALIQSVDTAHEIDSKASGLDPDELVRIANRIDSISPEELSIILSKVPKSWPVEDNELAVLGWFLSKRATSVAHRLRGLAQNNPRQS